MNPVGVVIYKLASGVNIQPNSSLPGTSTLESLVGGLMTIGFSVCVAGIVSSGIAWGWGHHSTNTRLVHRGREGLVAAVCAALLITFANAIVNWAGGLNIGFA